LGKRFLLLNHIGRRSGLRRQTVLEVVNYDADTNTYFIASGFGKHSDWYRNLLKTPAVSIQVGNRRINVMAHPLTPEQSGEAMVDYARRYPKAARIICRQVGYEIDGSEDDYRAVGREVIPFVELRQVELRQMVM
jgi:deazaflavin-dependent oxidoreductase (nitroreductase family)